VSGQRAAQLSWSWGEDTRPQAGEQLQATPVFLLQTPLLEHSSTANLAAAEAGQQL
jgi:hypothetical protein